MRWMIIVLRLPETRGRAIASLEAAVLRIDWNL
jgi:hypothetical protein